MKLKPRLWTWSGPVLIESRDDPGSQPAVWLAGLASDPAVEAHLLSLLSADERERHERFHRRDDRQRFLVGRGMLRLFLGTHLNISPARVVFECNPFGKPLLPWDGNAPSLHFNISHSGNFVLLAYSLSHEIGVDIEQLRPAAEWKELAAQVFSPAQLDAWLRCSPEAQARAFFQAWTRREAELKAIGVGLADDTRSVLLTRLRCFDLDLPPGYEGAVALLDPPTMS